MGYWASTQSTQTQEFRQESGTRNQIQVSGQPDPSSWFLSEHSLQLLKADFVYGPWLTPHEMATGTVLTYDAAMRRAVRGRKPTLWPVVPGGLLQVKFTHAP